MTTEKQDLQKIMTPSEQQDKGIILFNRQIHSLNKHHPKIKDFGDEAMREFRKRLNIMIMGLGFKNPVGEKTLKMIAAFVQTEFGQFCMEDVAIAFTKASAGKLGDDVGHFQTFDMQYLGKVCKAYGKHRKEQLKLAEEHDRQVKQDEEFESQEQKNPGKGWFELIQKNIDQKKELPFYADYNAAYKHAESEGLINLTDDDRSDFYKSVVTEIHREIVHHDATNTERKQLRDTLASKKGMKKECRTRYMKRYFTDKIKEDGK